MSSTQLTQGSNAINLCQCGQRYIITVAVIMHHCNFVPFLKLADLTMMRQCNFVHAVTRRAAGLKFHVGYGSRESAEAHFGHGSRESAEAHFGHGSRESAEAHFGHGSRESAEAHFGHGSRESAEAHFGHGSRV